MGPMCGQQAADAKSSNAAPGVRSCRADGTDGWKPGAADVVMAGRGARGLRGAAGRGAQRTCSAGTCAGSPLYRLRPAASLGTGDG